MCERKIFLIRVVYDMKKINFLFLVPDINIIEGVKKYDTVRAIFRSFVKKFYFSLSPLSKTVLPKPAPSCFILRLSHI